MSSAPKASLEWWALRHLLHQSRSCTVLTENSGVAKLTSSEMTGAGARQMGREDKTSDIRRQRSGNREQSTYSEYRASIQALSAIELH